MSSYLSLIKQVFLFTRSTELRGFTGRGRRKEPPKRPMQALPTSKPPAEQEGQPRECPVCLEEVHSPLLCKSFMQSHFYFELGNPSAPFSPHGANCIWKYLCPMICWVEAIRGSENRALDPEREQNFCRTQQMMTGQSSLVSTPPASAATTLCARGTQSWQCVPCAEPHSWNLLQVLFEMVTLLLASSSCLKLPPLPAIVTAFP